MTRSQTPAGAPSNRIVYLDSQATTPVDVRVRDRMLPFFTEFYGNPSSKEHRFGWQAEAAVEEAREIISSAIGAQSPNEIAFTSGATESNNLAILGSARRHGMAKRHILTVQSEHKAVLDPCRAWEREGGRVTYLAVKSDGLIDLDRLRDSLHVDTLLISVMMANNEIGVIQPVAEIGAIAKERGILFHCDAAQAAGKLPIDVDAMGIDLLSISAHKVYGPKGIGALFVRARGPRVTLAPLLFGGGQERGIRPGTLNLPGIAGLAKALEIATTEMNEERARLLALRDRLWNGLRAGLEDLVLNGHPDQRLPGNLNIAFGGIAGDALVAKLPDIALSSRSACTTGDVEPSHVLAAIGLNAESARASIRFGLGRFTTEAEIDYTVERVVAEAIKLRNRDPASKPAVSPQTV